MDNSVWLAMAVCAVGTFLLRVIPMLWMKRHLIRQSAAAAEAPMPVWLTVLAPTMIAAMFGVSLVPTVPGSLTLSAWLASAFGILVTLLVWRRTRSLGWPVCAGVLMFGVVKILAMLVAGW